MNLENWFLVKTKLFNQLKIKFQKINKKHLIVLNYRHKCRKLKK